MIMVAYVLFMICVLGFSVMACFSPTAETYLRDKDPRIWSWNWILFGFALVLACIVRLPLGVEHWFWGWLANFGICLGTGMAIFFVILMCSIAYHVFWPMFKEVLFPEH